MHLIGTRLPPRLLVIFLIVFPWCAASFGERASHGAQNRSTKGFSYSLFLVLGDRSPVFCYRDKSSRRLSKIPLLFFLDEELDPCSSSRLSKLTVKRLRRLQSLHLHRSSVLTASSSRNVFMFCTLGSRMREIEAL
jgi:hypothetical protein